MSNDSVTLIELDSRHRAALGKLARHDRYLVREEADGILIFTPAIVMSEMEAKLLQDHADLIHRLEEKMAHPEKLKRRRTL